MSILEVWRKWSAFPLMLFKFLNSYIPRRKLGIYWIQVRRAAAAAVEISLWMR